MSSSTSTDSLSDAEVISRSADDPELFGLLFDRHARSIRAYLQGRVGLADADGAVVDTFAAAFRARSAYDDRRGDALPWLVGFARNVARNDRRSGRRLSGLRARLHTSDRNDPPPIDIADRLDADRAGDRVRRSVAALPAEQQEVLLLVALAGMSYAEVAVALELPIGTVRSRLARGREQLRITLADLSPEEN